MVRKSYEIRTIKISSTIKAWTFSEWLLLLGSLPSVARHASQSATNIQSKFYQSQYLKSCYTTWQPDINMWHFTTLYHFWSKFSAKFFQRWNNFLTFHKMWMFDFTGVWPKIIFDNITREFKIEWWQKTCYKTCFCFLQHIDGAINNNKAGEIFGTMAIKVVL